MHNKRKVTMVLWADPRPYIAMIFTAKTLSDYGFSVEIIHRALASDQDVASEVDLGDNTRLRPIGRGHNGWRDKLDYVVFIFMNIVLLLRNKTDVVIGYNMFGIIAAFIATRLRPKTILIYHNFDFDSIQTTTSKVCTRFFRLLEISASRKSSLVIFPHLGRAEVFKDEARLDKDPIAVMNCYPLATPKAKTGKLQNLLTARGLCFDKLVVRLGMIGPYHGIEATIRSVLEWKGKWGLILAGFPGDDLYIEEIKKLVQNLGLDKRVVFLLSVPYSLWYDCLYSAHLGISLYESFNLSHIYMSGTSQKLNNYFVAGIPSIVSNSPDFSAFVEKYGTSKTADPLDPHSIAKAVNSLLCDPKEYTTYCQNVKNAFKSEFNFEKQFEPVLNWLIYNKNNKTQ